MQREELQERNKKIQIGQQALGDEAKHVDEDRGAKLEKDEAAMEAAVNKIMEDKKVEFTKDLVEKEQKLEKRNQELIAREAKFDKKNSELKLREQKSNLVLTPNVVIDKSGAPQLAMEKWTVA